MTPARSHMTPTVLFNKAGDFANFHCANYSLWETGAQEGWLSRFLCDATIYERLGGNVFNLDNLSGLDTLGVNQIFDSFHGNDPLGSWREAANVS